MKEQHRGIQDLVDKAAGGDRSAFDELVRSQEGRLRSSARARLGPGRAAEVDDVLQETFVLAFEAIDRFQWRGEESFHSWLSRIARNVTIDRIKDAGRGRFLEVPEALPAGGASPSGSLRRGERFERLEKAISELPPDYREVIRLSKLERLKVKEIARRMNRSDYAVKHLLIRALRGLRARFGDTESLNLPDRSLRVEGGTRGGE